MSGILLSLTTERKTWFEMTDGEADVLREIATQEEKFELFKPMSFEKVDEGMNL